MSIALKAVKQNRIAAIAFAAVWTIAPSAASATEMTAGVVMKEMPAGERAAYVMGIVEGLAYARFRKDTEAAGAKTVTGMRCMYDWLYTDTKAGFDRVDAAFSKYPEHFPSTLLATMLKKECGE